MGNVLLDLRYAIRQLIKSPGFAAVAVLSLALGIGANTAIFSVFNALFLKALPGERPQELVSIYTSDFSSSDYSATSFLDFQDLRQRNETLSGMFCFTPFPSLLSSSDSSERVFGEFVSGNYFDVIGVRPQAGRWFLPEEDRTPETHPVVVISDAVWQRRFQRAPGVAGTTVNLNGNVFTIVGVAPAGFTGMLRGFSSDFWTPTMTRNLFTKNSNDLTNRGSRGFFVMGRLKPNVTIAQARANFNVLAAQLHDAYPAEWTNIKKQPRILSILPESESRVFPQIRGPILGFLALLMIVVGIVLLIACSNVANLLLVKSAARRREIAVRLSIGASRKRLIQQLLTESILLSIAAGAAGLLVASWTRNALGRFEPPVPIPLSLNLQPDSRVLLFALATSILTAAFFGLAPAFQSTRHDISATLKDAGTSERRHAGRLRNVLVVAQLGLSLLLLIGAGLFVRSLGNASSIDPGFDSTNLLMMSIDVEPRGYDAANGTALYTQVLGRLASIPGVQSAGIGEQVELGLAQQRRGTRIEGYTAQPGEDMEISFNRVGPGYFETLKIPMLRGRSFNGADVQGGPNVVIVNQAFANRYWPGQDPLGKRIESGNGWMEVVGIAKDGKYRTLGENPRPYIFLPLYQNYETTVTFVVRSALPSDVIVNAARKEIAAIDGSLPLFDVKTGEQHMNFALLPARIAGSLLGVFGIVALMLAAIGIYGVMSFSVAQRTREMGIRLALGAGRAAVMRMVIAQGMRLAVIGMAIGMIFAAMVTRFAATFLYGISPTDPITFVSIFGILGSVAFMACYIPARRATRVDPMIALRYE